MKDHTFLHGSCIRKYRIFLYLAIALAVLSLLFLFLFRMYQSIPSTLRIREGSQATLSLEGPLSAHIAPVSAGGSSNISEGAVTVDTSSGSLSKLVTFHGDKLTGASSFTIRLFGLIPFKEMQVQVMEDQELIPVGVPIGIYVKTDGLLVVGTGSFPDEGGNEVSPARSLLHSGDYIQAINGTAVQDKEAFMELVNESKGIAVTLTVKRKENLLFLTITPQKTQSGDYKLGIWVRDNAQGIGTMTYLDAEGNFGALGHGINDVDTSALMTSHDGTIYETQILSIKKGKSGSPGEMTGMIIYSEENILGDITKNTQKGLFGTCRKDLSFLWEAKPLPIALKQEIKTGPAQILLNLQSTQGLPAYYDIEITDIHLDQEHINRGLELKITDPALLSLTGGIVQGMSGAPIIQDGRIIGAVTHVLVNSPAKGYGIFIETMLQ